MNLRSIRIILTKELRDVLSERVYWVAFVLELVIVLGVILLGIAFATMINPAEMATAVPRFELKIGILAEEQLEGNQIVLALLGEDIRLFLMEGRALLEERIAVGSLMGGMVFPQDYREDGGKEIRIELLLDESKVYSSLVRSRVESAVDRANRDISKGRLLELGLEGGGTLSLAKTSVGRPVIPISSPDFVEAMYLMVIPLIMIFPVLLSANMTSDSFVGEKENGTLGILMATPASRLDIVLGKLIPVLLLANLQFLAWLFLLENNILGSVRVFNKIPLLALLNLGAFCFVGISLLISIRARSTKESNLYLTLVIMVLVFPLFMGVPEMGIITDVLDSVTLVKTIGYVAASPGLGLSEYLIPLISLGAMGLAIMMVCARSVSGLEPPPSR